MSKHEKLDPSATLELEHLYQHAALALCVIDTDFRYVRVNQRLCDINGKTMDEHLGHTLQEVIPHLADQIVPMFQSIFDSAQPVPDYEIRGETLRHPGQERRFIGSHFPMFADTGEVKYVHTIVRDITMQRRAEDALREANEQLEERVRLRTEELEKLSEELLDEMAHRIHAEEEASLTRLSLSRVTRLRSMGELAASIAHELNQPLAAVLTNAEVAQRHLASDSPDLAEVGEILDDIIADDRRAGAVIRRLQTLLQEGPVVREVVRLEDLVSGIMAMVRSEAIGAGVKLSLTCAADLPEVELEIVSIQQVTINLILNAIEVLCGVDGEERVIAVEVSRQGEHEIRVAISDNGPGLPSEADVDVFESFVTTKAEGLGMGLTICRSILDAHGGAISLQANDPHGCCAAFVLPLRRPKET